MYKEIERVKEIWVIMVLVIYTKSYKKRKKKLKPKKRTCLFGACLPFTRIDDVPLLEGERSMTDEIFPIPDLHCKMKGRAILP